MRQMMFENVKKTIWKNKFINESIGYASLGLMLVGLIAGIICSPHSFVGKLVGISIGLLLSSIFSIFAYHIYHTKFNLTRSKEILKYTDKIEDCDIVLEQNNTDKIEAKDFLSLKQYIAILRKYFLQQYISLNYETQLEGVVDRNFLKEKTAKFVSLNATFPHAFKINVFDQINTFSFFNYAVMSNNNEILSILLKLGYEIKPIDILSLKENVEDEHFKEPIDTNVFNFLLEKQFYHSFDANLKKAIVNQLQESPNGREKQLAELIKELANPENAKILENGEISTNLYKDIYKLLANHRTKLKGEVLRIIDEIEYKIKIIQNMKVENYATKIELSTLFDKDLPTLLNSYQEIQVSPHALEYEKALIENLLTISNYLDDLINNKELDLSFNFKTQASLIASKYKRSNEDKLTMQTGG